MKVSVVVPLYNTGREVEGLLDSLRAQTLPVDEWEAVLVDDGSSDDTADIVEALIAGDRNMRLLREAPSGWPGRPRNVGMDAARGDYVFFSDDDDALGPEALERLTRFATDHGSDIVVPRTVGRNRAVPEGLVTVIDAQREPALIASTMAPQKLFRRAFLQQHGIRFVEGHWRLEDHLFVTTAYLRAQRVSIYADYPCYYLTFQPGRPHISQQQPDWRAYYDSVRACLDRVDEAAPDPLLRRALRNRWLQVEALSRLRGDGHARAGSPELVREVRRLLAERYGPDDLEGVEPIERALALLLLDGRDEDVAALAAWESSATVTSEATAARVGPDGSVEVELRSVLTVEGSLPALDDGTGRYPAPQELEQQVAASTRVGVELQHAATKVRQSMQVTHAADGRTRAVLVPGPVPLAPGRWTVVALAGEHRTRRRRAVDAAAGAAVAPAARVGDETYAFLGTGRLVLRIATYTPPAPVPLRTRVRRRVRRMLPKGFRVPRLLRAVG